MTEATNNFSACDMATAAAQGFRDGVASVRPDHVEDVRAMVVPDARLSVALELLREAGEYGGLTPEWHARRDTALAAAPTPEQPAKEQGHD